MAPRRLEPELMDDPSIDPAQHRRALVALERLNRASRTGASLWSAIAPFASNDQPLRVLDIASGGGDVARAIYRRAVAAGVEAQVVGADISDTAVAHANQIGGGPTFVQLDAINVPLPTDFDVITSTLFLHHLQPADVVKLLSNMAGAARKGVVISDLARGRWCRFVSWVGTRAMTRSPIVHTDAMLSVSAAFTIDEMTDLAEAAGLGGATIRRCWPGRFVLTWSKP